MFYDYHLHCNFSHDSKEDIQKIVKMGISLNLKEICFTDHIDYSVLVNGEERDYSFDVKEYFKTLTKIKEKYEKEINIKIGVEIGLQSHILDKCKKLVLDNDFDFVLGSIHTINKNELYRRDLFKNRSQKEAYKIYYEALYNVIKNYKEYSVLGHLDVVKRYGDIENITEDKEFFDIIDEILKLVIKDGKGIEINTSSFRYKLPDLTPSKYILTRYKELGGEIITTGSDSHVYEHLSYNFALIYDILKEIGYKYICSFEKMKPNFIKL